MVARQRTRIRADNEKATRTQELLDDVWPRELTPTQVARELDCSPEYAYDLLNALVARSTARKVGRGKYQSANAEIEALEE